MSREGDDGRLSRHQLRTLSCILDRIVPPSHDDRFPGAGELGLATVIERDLREAPDRIAAVSEGLAALDAAARERGAGGFAALPDPAGLEVLLELEEAHPGFLPGLVFQTYVAYYQSPRVLEALGLEPRPPHPEGYQMEPGDLGLLDRVRRKGKRYREC